MVKAIRRFSRQNSGTAAIEYGLLVAVVSVSVIAGGEIVSESINALFDEIHAKLEDLIASI